MNNVRLWSNDSIVLTDDKAVKVGAPKWYSKIGFYDPDFKVVRGTTFDCDDMVIAISIKDFDQANELKDLSLSDEPVPFDDIIEKVTEPSWIISCNGVTSDKVPVQDVEKGIVYEAIIPISKKMIAEDSDKKLRSLGFRSPGWYRWIQTTDHKGERITHLELLVSMKGF